MHVQEQSFLLPELFLSPLVISRLTDTNSKTNRMYDKEKYALLNLLFNNINEAEKAYRENNYSKFDALVKNYGCQLLAFKNLDLAMSKTFPQELQKLKAVVDQARNNFEALRKKLPAFQKNSGNPYHTSVELSQFFKDNVCKISLSSDMAFFLQAHLLTYIRYSSRLMDQTQVQKLNKLVKISDVAEHHFEDIVDQARVQLSAASIVELRKEAEKNCSLPAAEAKRTVSMLENVHLASTKHEKPKSHACQFYSMKAVLAALQERETVVLLKKWVRGSADKPMTPIAFRVDKATGSFVRLPDNEMNTLPSSTPIVVMEGLVNSKYERDQVVDYMLKYDLGKVALMDTAQEDQFVKGSRGLEFINDPDAVSEVEAYAKKGVEIKTDKNDKENSFFWLDHMYCSSLKEELKNAGGNL